MTVSVEQFTARLAESRLLSEEQMTEARQHWSGLSPTDSAEPLAKTLVKEGLLTAYQTRAIWQGKHKRLVLGNYVLLEKLGEGGMGVVFKAEHRRMSRVVALKVLSPKVTSDPVAVERFRREVRAAAQLTHPNIVAALDADESKGLHFLVMEFVDGSDLSRVVKEKGPLSVEVAVPFIIQAARGLAHAHGKGLIHRDIKPSNLLVDRSGDLKILDMGLARFESAPGDLEGSEPQLTTTGTVMGTVDFMSPEQALDSKQADHRADVYSLGCSLFFLLTGRAMYSHDTVMKKLLAHREEAIPTLRSLRQDVPDFIDVAFQRMVAKNPADRQQSMSDIISELERQPIQAAAAVATAAPLITQRTEDSQLQAFLDGVESEGGSPVDPAAASDPSFEETVISDGGIDTDNIPVRAASPAPRRRSGKKPAVLISAVMGILLLLTVVIWAVVSNTGDRAEKLAGDDSSTESSQGHRKVGNRKSGQGRESRKGNGRSGKKNRNGVLGSFQPKFADGAYLAAWKSIPSQYGPVTTAAFSPAGSRIAFGTNAQSSGSLVLWNLSADKEVSSLVAHSYSNNSLVFSKDGEWIVTGGTDDAGAQLKVWSSRSIALSHAQRGHDHHVVELAISEDGTRLITGSNDGTARLWDPVAWEELFVLEGHSESVFGVAISPNCQRVATSDRAGKVRIWSALTGKIERTLQIDGLTHCLEFLTDDVLISAGDTKPILVWDVTRGSILREMENSRFGCQSTVLSPDRNLLVTGARGGMLRLYSPHSGALLQTVESQTSHDVHDLAFSHDGRALASTSTLGEVHLWAVKPAPIPASSQGSQNTSSGNAPPPTETRDDEQNFALQCTGNRERVEFPFAWDGSHPITVEALVTPAAVTLSNPVVASGTGQGFVLGIVDSHAVFGIWARDTDGSPVLRRASARLPVRPGTRNHLAGTFDGKVAQVFLNGEASAPVDVASSSAALEPGSQLGIGALPGDSQDEASFTGLIDAVRISRSRRYVETFTPPVSIGNDPDTMAAFSFDQDGEVAVNDADPSAHGKLIEARRAGPWTGPFDERWVYSRLNGHRFGIGQTAALTDRIHETADVLEESWKRVTAGWRSERQLRCRIALPIAAYGSYELRFNFTRHEGDNAIHAVLPVGNAECGIVIAGKSDTASGLSGISRVEGHLFHANETTVESTIIQNGKRHTVAIAVQIEGDSASIRTELDGATLIDWSGPQQRLTGMSREMRPPGFRQLEIGTWSIDATIGDLELKVLDGFAQLARPDPSDRDTARWIVQQGTSNVKLLLAEGRQKPARSVDELPTEPFRIGGFTFQDIEAFDVAALERFQAIPHLSYIGFVRVPVNDAALKAFSHVQGLGGLTLAATQITGTGFADLQHPENIASLNLSDSPVSSEGLKTICATVTGISDLNLSKTMVTDEGLRPVSQLTKLEQLSLFGTSITDAGLASLQQCRTLRRLNLQSCPQITDSGIEKLREALPNCDITVGEQ